MLNYSILKDEELVALSKNNDDKALTVLTERYIPLSKTLASRFCNSAAEKDDLAQEGMFGFIAAVYAYDENSGASFSTFTGHCIRNKIISAIRAMSSKKRIPLQLTVSLDDRQDCPSDDLTPEESFISREDFERISALIENGLTEKERSVFLLFLQGKSYEQIAAECSCTAKSVDGTLQRVRKKLRENLS